MLAIITLFLIVVLICVFARDRNARVDSAVDLTIVKGPVAAFKETCVCRLLGGIKTMRKTSAIGGLKSAIDLAADQQATLLALHVIDDGNLQSTSKVLAIRLA